MHAGFDMVSDSMLREGEAGFSLLNRQMKREKPSRQRGLEGKDEFPSEKDFEDSSCPVLSKNLAIEELADCFHAAISSDTRHQRKSIDRWGNLVPSGGYSPFLLSNQHVSVRSIDRYGNFRMN